MIAAVLSANLTTRMELCVASGVEEGTQNAALGGTNALRVRRTVLLGGRAHPHYLVSLQQKV